MLAVKVPAKEAQKAKDYLVKSSLLDDRFSVKREDGHVLFPVLKRFETEHEFVDAELDKREKPAQGLKESLAGEMSKEELERVRASLDVIGDIAIIELPRELGEKAGIIAKHILGKNIKTVLRKGKHEGELRVQRLGFLAGEDKMGAVHKENGVRVKLDVEKVYFSPRQSEERKRIAGLVKAREKVLVMFSGCGIYGFVIARGSEAKEVVCVELNPEGHKYALESFKLNKMNNLRFYEGDVKDVLPRLNEKFDRVIMPLPKSAEKFLPEALSAANKGCVLHFYDFEKEDEIDKAKTKVIAACQKAGRKCKVLRVVKCGQLAPRAYRICVDVEVY